MGGTKYIPSNVSTFCTWAKVMASYAELNHERWGVEMLDESLAPKLTRLETLANLCTTSKRTAEDIVERNTLRKEVESGIRIYLQGFVMRNPHVTELDRTAMGLPLRDTKPTPVGDPVGLVTATVKYPNEGALELHIEHVESSPFDKRANYGVKIAYDVFPIDAPLPEDAARLRRNVFTRRWKELFSFGRGERRRKAVFCLRYENSKGKAGLWGPMVEAVIP